MLHVDRYLVPAMLLLVVLFVTLKLLLAPVEAGVAIRLAPEMSLVIRSNESYRSGWQRGWPWVFQEEYDASGFRPLDPEFTDRKFSWPLLIADLLVLSVIGATLIAIGLRHRRRRGAWMRISLRELLVLVTLFGICFGWWARNSAQGRREQQLLPLYRFLDARSGYAGPEWLRRLLPDSALTIFERVSAIRPDTESYPDLVSAEPEKYETHWHLSPDTIEMAKRALLELPYARHLTIYNGSGQRVVYDKPTWRDFDAMGLKRDAANGFGQIDDAYFGLTEMDDRAGYLVSQLTGVKSAEFEYCKFLGHIVDKIAELRSVEDLRFYDCEGLDDAALAKLVSMHELRKLTLQGTDSSDNSAATILRFPRLEYLWIGGHGWTDAGIGHLEESPSLRHLVLYDTSISDETVRQLRRKMQVIVKAADRFPLHEFTVPSASPNANFDALIELIRSTVNAPEFTSRPAVK